LTNTAAPLIECIGRKKISRVKNNGVDIWPLEPLRVKESRLNEFQSNNALKPSFYNFDDRRGQTTTCAYNSLKHNAIERGVDIYIIPQSHTNESEWTRSDINCSSGWKQKKDRRASFIKKQLT